MSDNVLGVHGGRNTIMSDASTTERKQITRLGRRVDQRLFIALSLILGGSHFSLQGQVTSNIRPFYLERGSYHIGTTGQDVMFAHDVVARRGDGATVYITFLKEGPSLRKVILPDTSSTWLVDSVRAKTTWPAGSDEASGVIASVTSPQPDCRVGSRITGRAMVSGQATLQSTNVVDSARRMVFWVAPELGCETLRYQEVIGSDTVVNEVRVIKLVLGNPDSRVFELGNGYEEVLPSELIVKQYRAGGRTNLEREFLGRLAMYDRELVRLPRGAR